MYHKYSPLSQLFGGFPRKSLVLWRSWWNKMSWRLNSSFRRLVVAGSSKFGHSPTSSICFFFYLVVSAKGLPKKGYPSLHLSKRLNDLIQNCAQEKTPFSFTVFNTLSHGVNRFVAKKNLLAGWNSFEANARRTEHTMWRGMENCATKWCLFMCTILFEVTWAFCKLCARFLIEFSKVNFLAI